MPREGDQPIISVGDVGDKFRIETNRDLAGATNPVLIIEAQNDLTQAWEHVADVPATIVDIANGIIEAVTTSPSPFQKVGFHRFRAAVVLNGQTQEKFGDYTKRWVYEGRTN